MIQLKVFLDELVSSDYFLDLYETSPLKVSMSVEDLQAKTTSAFSRPFRVPANEHNAKFFKTAFMVEGNDFDVTIKKPAEILVDGAQFQSGHIRLQKIFTNAVTGKIDYEILFLGETRDFASALGDASMCDLVMNDISHTFNLNNIELSWTAYPDTPGASGTTGLVSGNVLYPLIDFGNNYDNNGVPLESRISTDQSIAGHPFTNQGHPIEINRFKPMIRAKRLWDAIFDAAGFTYTSDFIGTTGNNTDVGIFKQLYVSAFGNDQAITVDETLGSADNFQASCIGVECQGGCGDHGIFNVEINDPGSNYNPLTSIYTAPASGNYTFFSRIDALGVSGGGTSDRNSEYYSFFESAPAGSSSFFALPNTNSICTAFGIINNTKTVTLTAGDQVRVGVDCCGGGGDTPFESLRFECTSSPSAGFNPTPFLDCEYKQIDFIKDVLTSFRMVMQPNPAKDRDFIVEPWINFHSGGEVLDWSGKLINDKDMVIEPLFYSQTEEIDFNLEEDTDLVAEYHRKVYKENYGYLEFDANNELLKGKREIKVNYAPTPLTVVQGEPNNSAWVIPRLCSNETEEQVQFLPIKAKTRFLFFNGSKVTHPTQPIPWYVVGGPSGGFGYYPVVSPISGQAIGTPSPNNIILQWYDDVIYYTPTNTTTWEGTTMYDTYWQTYIQSLYATYARKVTAYFTLNYLDLYDFTFDKVIFVNGSYYTVSKITDAPVGERAAVKVELIKELAYAPPTETDNSLTLAQEYNTAAPACTGGAPFQTVTYQGNLTVGTVLIGFGGVSGNNGFFKITGANNEPGFISQVLGVNDDDEVISINNICP